jgi:hypothetical protein
VTPQKFALQLYSRLTNANPELVLVFMQAGGSGKQVPTRPLISSDTNCWPGRLGGNKCTESVFG